MVFHLSSMTTYGEPPLFLIVEESEVALSIVLELLYAIGQISEGGKVWVLFLKSYRLYLGLSD